MTPGVITIGMIKAANRLVKEFEVQAVYAHFDHGIVSFMAWDDSWPRDKRFSSSDRGESIFTAHFPRLFRFWTGKKFIDRAPEPYLSLDDTIRLTKLQRHLKSMSDSPRLHMSFSMAHKHEESGAPPSFYFSGKHGVKDLKTADLDEYFKHIENYVTHVENYDTFDDVG